MNTDAREVTVISVESPDKRQLASWKVLKRSLRDSFAQVRDEWWSATFGTLQQALRRIDRRGTFILDFSCIEWIDPLPLLSVLVSIKEFSRRTASSVEIRLGHEPSANEQRGGFLKFIAQHGFLTELAPSEQPLVINYGGRDYYNQKSTKANETQETKPPENSIATLCTRLSSEAIAMAYPESRCLTAKVVAVASVGKVADADADIQKIIGPWLNELRDYGLKPFFEGDPESVEDLLHKIRVLLTEMVTNAAEHAYLDEPGFDSHHVGIYARIRKGTFAPTSPRLDEALKRESLDCPTLSRFSREASTSWIEIFYVDSGRGLLADLDAWAAHADDELKAMLTKLKPQSNTLFEFANYFFQQPLSRHRRDNRTTLTGLQHINLVLSDGRDFARAYTRGQWCGDHHPWSHHVKSGDKNLTKQYRYKEFESCAGTAWHFCLGLEAAGSAEEDKRFDDWSRIQSTDVERPAKGKTPYSDWTPFDERDCGSGITYINWRTEPLRGSSYLWLPGAVTKQHIYQWLNAAIKQRQESSVASTWIIADLSREQAQTFASVLLNQKKTSSGVADLFVYIITYDWYIQCLRPDATSALSFTADRSLTRRTVETRAADIFELLRTHDSKLFWKNVSTLTADPIESALVDEEVIWARDPQGNPSVLLRGYLDLTQALVSPQRAAIAARALRRTWFLYARGAECVRADVLLDNILPREARHSLKNSSGREGEQETQRVIVSSVYVTGSTADRAKEAGREVIHLLRHTQFEPGKGYDHPPSQTTSRFALNWIDTPIDPRPVPEGQLRYERIPGTPYIGRGGPKAIPVRRFKRRQANGRYFVESIYKQNPEEMYEHFLALGILKLGHWVYGSHHDLLTINLGLAIDRENLDHGPVLQWLCKELQSLKQEGAELVVYSSHPVTEKMIQAIKRSATFGNGYELPARFIPIHFLGTHTQTAIRIPSLTYDRIRQFLDPQPANRAEGESPRKQPKKVILLDDGALTGKVQRELEQLVRNAGATDIVHLSLVTRTGLPLYRQYLVSEHVRSHRHYWRWDVPPLGNARTCPLCRALQQAKDLMDTMWSAVARKELESWQEQWRQQSTLSHWWRHGLAPEQLPEIRPITFGKEWPKDRNRPEKYSIPHVTTTGLASTVTELIRITSYKHVGLKIARQPWPEQSTASRAWRRAQMEILICQTMLFFDDFDPQELDERFEMLFHVLLGDDTDVATQSIERLACLALLLTSEAQAHKIMTNFRPEVLVATNFPTHSLIALGILARRAKISLRKISDTLRDIEDPNKHALIEGQLSSAYALSQREISRGTKRAILTLVLLLGENDICAHTGFLHKKTSGQIRVKPESIAIDLGLAAQAIREIDANVLSEEHVTDFNREARASLLEDLVERLQTATDADSETAVSRVHARLFGDHDSLSEAFRKTFFSTPEKIQEYLRHGISVSEWKKKIVSDTTEALSQRWNDGDLLPVIKAEFADNDDNGKRQDGDTIVFPPIARQMVRDFLWDVRHSSAPYPASDPDHRYDMNCILHIRYDGMFVIEMRNLATDRASHPRLKLSEVLVSRELLEGRPAVMRARDKDEMVTTIFLPLVTGLVRESL